MPTNINFDKKLGFISRTSIVLPTSTEQPFLDATSWFGDGVDDQLLSTSDFRSIDNGTQFSWSFWFKLDTIAPNQTLIRLNTNTSTQGFHVFFRGGASLQLEAFVEGSSSNWTRSGTGSVKQANKWYHVCVTLDNTTGNRYTMLKIYLDGVYQGNSNFFSPNMGVGTNLSFLANIDGTLPANANIDEIACWGQGTVLTATQVLEIFNKGLANDLNNLPTAPQPTNWWRSETATWNGFAWTLTDVNASHPMRSQNMLEANKENDVPSLYSNKSFTFDGVDDYIDCGTITQINGGINAFSVSLWFKYTGTLSGTDNILISGANGTANDFYIQPISATTIRYGHGSTFTDTTTSNMPINTWQHILAIHNLDTITIYLNGTLQGSASGKPNPNANIGNNFRIGDYQPLTTYRFQGNIDEVAIWDNDQSTNITSIFNQGVPTSLESLNPISHWRMGEDATWNGTNWTLNDNGSGGNNGTSQNMVLASRTNDVPLFNTKSILFDGVDDLVNCGNVAEFNSPTEMSISAWFKTSATTRQTIASKTYYRIELESTSGRINFAVYYTSSNGRFAYTPSGTSYQDGQWHHVLCTHEVNGRLKMYVDGVLLADISGTPSNIFGSSLPFVIGNRNLTQSTRFNGNIDDVAFWDSELSSTDITSIYNNGVPNNISNLSPLSWWRMGDYDSYPTLIDRGSGNNNGTMTNMTSASIVDDVPE